MEMLLRPLLYATGAAAGALGGYILARSDEDTVLCQHQEQMEAENSDLRNQVLNLQGKLQKMMNLLSENHWTCDELSTKYMRDLETYSLRKFNFDERAETLMHNKDALKDAVTEAEEKIQTLVLSNFKLEVRMRQLEELLCASPSDGDMENQHDLSAEKHQEAIIVQLELETSDLRDRVETLRGKLRKIMNLHSESYRTSDELTTKYMRDLEGFSLCNSGETSLKHNKEALKGKHQKTIAQLKAEKADLEEHAETLLGSMQKMMNLLSENHRACDELMTKYMRDLEAYSLRKDSLFEMEEKWQMAVETIEEREADLRDQVETLQGTMQDTRILHSGRYCDVEELQKEYEREQEGKGKYGEMKTLTRSPSLR
ncbi:leucine-rich repeat flightless-interacting protein 1-like isoform X1, partial [Clarias magur]